MACIGCSGLVRHPFVVDLLVVPGSDSQVNIVTGPEVDIGTLTICHVDAWGLVHLPDSRLEPEISCCKGTDRTDINCIQGIGVIELSSGCGNRKVVVSSLYNG